MIQPTAASLIHFIQHQIAVETIIIIPELLRTLPSPPFEKPIKIRFVFKPAIIIYILDRPVRIDQLLLDQI